MEINGMLIKRVWAKAIPIQGQNPDVFRTDINGVWIRLKDYNNVDSIYGWTIYQLTSQKEEGTKNIMNLIPVHTHNNVIPLAGVNSSVEDSFKEKFI